MNAYETTALAAAQAAGKTAAEGVPEPTGGAE